MSIIVQVGHSSSYSNQFMQMLYKRGLGEPLKSHTYQLTAEEVTDKLVKILQKNNSPANSKIIDNLLVDLLLSNLDQDDWGWSSECNLEILDYWKNIDESVRFILIFDSPKLLLKNLLGQTITTEILETAIREWIAYHQKLLTFFENSTKNCLLIEGELAVNNLMNVKDHIQAITTNFKLENNKQTQDSEIVEKTDNNPMFEIIANEILVQYPACIALYDTLIKKSSIRFKNKKLPTKNILLGLIDSLNVLNEQQVLQKTLLSENNNLQNQLMVLMSEKQSLEQQLSQNVSLEQNKNNINTKQENELLISQLHQVQEELERYYLENQKLKSEQKKEPPKPVYYGAADRVKEDLPYRLGATMVNHSKSAKDLAVLPLALAKEYREFNKNKPNDELPAIEEYQDAYEAEKVKKHLSYRLGKTLVDGLKSPKSAIDLPVKLGKEIVGFGKK